MLFRSGTVKVDPENQHTWKVVRIGKINDTGLIDEVYSSKDAVQPDPFLKKIEWAKGLAEGATK